ncbi:helix-turn-helix domain-containing protein [Flavobacterium sp. K5-23]|uniref:helix-turn-helix domain-containing protein n=1 Tax=Flavobacterium sp. K5-23 TaxID=2746225 RepID=UPI0020101601|nr:helix-turn-helix domain-containing protein [Flavobacterium sp. K5-23]UQD57222.1 helix-turn-helix domain-containing protein [Flavobacterium sp. K5-23]
MDIRIIKKLHEFLMMERTGNPKDLANKLGVSERTVYNYISYMKKEMNAPIMFDNQKGNYWYNRVCELNFKG